MAQQLADHLSIAFSQLLDQTQTLQRVHCSCVCGDCCEAIQNGGLWEQLCRQVCGYCWVLLKASLRFEAAEGKAVTNDLRIDAEDWAARIRSAVADTCTVPGELGNYGHYLSLAIDGYDLYNQQDTDS